MGDKAKDKSCSFYDPEYHNNCSALKCRSVFCGGCTFYIPKSDKRHQKLMKQFDDWYKNYKEIKPSQINEAH